jgi:hypothetical protein
MRRGELSLSHSLENLDRKISYSKPETANQELHQLKINNIEMKKQVVNVDI